MHHVMISSATHFWVLWLWISLQRVVRWPGLVGRHFAVHATALPNMLSFRLLFGGSCHGLPVGAGGQQRPGKYLVIPQRVVTHTLGTTY